MSVLQPMEDVTTHVITLMDHTSVLVMKDFFYKKTKQDVQVIDELEYRTADCAT